ncbi:MAG: AAA family ATPase [Sodaliphilus sp.]|nr:AAA family ATPase [Sodaliphilus sp.]
MEQLQATFHKLLGEITTKFHRYMYGRINWNARMIGLMGPRGVGKTTLVLQHIKEQLPRKESLYVQAEDFYFASHRLTELADAFAKIGGKYLFIDEIHKYKDWSRELKLIYDYHAELHVVFTGSSVLDIAKGASDLSRRALMYEMQGLSYREYLELFHNIHFPLCTLQQLVNQEVDMPSGFLPLQHFADYLQRGYYPFANGDINQYIQQMVNVTIETDIPQYADMSVATARKLKRLLAIIAQSAPFKPNMSQIGGQLEVSRNNVADLCVYLEKAGLIGQLRTSTGGIQGLGKVDKVYLDNTPLIYALGNQNVEIGTVRETFFFNQTRSLCNVSASPISDFLIDGKYTFEVGGKKKKQRQLQGIEDGFVVKDDIETGYGNIIPLWLFGMLY